MSLLYAVLVLVVIGVIQHAAVDGVCPEIEGKGWYDLARTMKAGARSGLLADQVEQEQVITILVVRRSASRDGR
jgi:hypothetical protein